MCTFWGNLRRAVQFIEHASLPVGHGFLPWEGSPASIDPIWELHDKGVWEVLCVTVEGLSSSSSASLGDSDIQGAS